MISKQIKIQELMDLETTRFTFVKEDNNVFVWFFESDTKHYKIKLDASSVATLLQKRQQAKAFLEQTVTLSGAISETWTRTTEKRTVDVPVWQKT